MKLIFITREGYDLAGARIRCYNIARELRKYGMEAKVFSFADTLGAKSGKDEHMLKAREKLKYNLDAFKKLKREKNAVFILNRFHYHSFAPWFLHILNGNKLIFDLDDWESRENPRYYLGLWPSSKAEFLTRRLAKQACLCIGASRFLVDYLSQFNKKTYYIPSGVDTDLFRLQEHKKDNEKVVFSWLGTMHRKDDIENIKFIIDCFQKISSKYENISLEITGDGIYFNSLKQILNGYNRNIFLKGWIPPEQMPDYLSTIDIGLVPLIQNTKFNQAKSPTKLFEYMAMAKPTVSSNIGEVNHIIKNGQNGFIALSRQDFLNKMEILINHAHLRKEMGEKARKDIEHRFSLNKIGEYMYDILLNSNV
jgi:glycosyltransferase involved in cell wall biosynthesis